jgi:hypothetical protein
MHHLDGDPAAFAELSPTPRASQRAWLTDSSGSSGGEPSGLR